MQEKEKRSKTKLPEKVKENRFSMIKVNLTVKEKFNSSPRLEDANDVECKQEDEKVGWLYC